MDIDRLGFPNVGNNIFYDKEFTVGAMLPVVAPDNTTAPIRREISDPPVMDSMVKETNKKILKFNEEPLTDEEKELYEKTIVEYGEFPITRSYGIYIKAKGEENEHYNAIVEISGYSCKFRGRSEMIIIKDNQIFLQKISEKDYRIPGGGWDNNEKHDLTAKREAEEEANIVVKNIVFGAKRVFIPDDYEKWVKENIPEGDRWLGYYTEVFVGEFDSYYNGDVHKDDQDKDFQKKGKFYDLDEAWSFLHEDHKRAINKFLAVYGTKIDKTEKEEEVKESVDLFNFFFQESEDEVLMEYVKNRSSIPDDEFGIPQERKYPLDTKKHVESAIKLFNHVDEKYEKQLAEKIIKKAKKFGVDLSLAGEKNRLRNYIVTSERKEG